MMVEVVRNGSGVFAAVPGLTVGGKTGTAEVGEGIPPHAWFIGFAADPTRTVVIAVMVENGGQGADIAAPIFAPPPGRTCRRNRYPAPNAAVEITEQVKAMRH
jgi:cell division protein FtsI/penicillin-binding protein 2